MIRSANETCEPPSVRNSKGLNMDLLSLFQQEIPITKSLGVFDCLYRENQFFLKAPIDLNRNHQRTFFGGSMYSCAALSAYGLFLQSLREKDFLTKDIVVSEGSFQYLKPARSEIQVRAYWPDEKSKLLFFDTLKAKGKARIQICADVVSEGVLCGKFQGDFVAFYKSSQNN